MEFYYLPFIVRCMGIFFSKSFVVSEIIAIFAPALPECFSESGWCDFCGINKIALVLLFDDVQEPRKFKRHPMFRISTNAYAIAWAGLINMDGFS